MKDEHWAKKLKNSTSFLVDSETLEDIWTHRVACYWQGIDEQTARKAARLCIETHCCVWHAVAIMTDRLKACRCVPCVRLREEGAA